LLAAGAQGAEFARELDADSWRNKQAQQRAKGISSCSAW
jgi:hypothetical protein